MISGNYQVPVYLPLINQQQDPSSQNQMAPTYGHVQFRGKACTCNHNYDTFEVHLLCMHSLIRPYIE